MMSSDSDSVVNDPDYSNVAVPSASSKNGSDDENGRRSRSKVVVKHLCRITVPF